MRRLAMGFQPIFMSGQSLRRHDKTHWERKVRPSVVPAQDAACVICCFVAEERRLIHADEVWAFPGAPQVTLADVRPLCSRCHEAKDFSQLLDLIKDGTKQPQRATEIRQHYCEVNGCNVDEFEGDFDKVFAVKRAIEAEYGMNCRPAVDYGKWARSPDKPRLTETERRLIRNVLALRDEPIEILGYTSKTYRSAVHKLQSVPASQRPAIIAEIESLLDEEDGEFEMFPDHECPWDIKMARD